MYPHDFAMMRYREHARRVDRINREAWKLASATSPTDPRDTSNDGSRSSNLLRRIAQSFAVQNPSVDSIGLPC